VGIVDVPGHENFIKTMVAGASGMDAVILVVAADDGVMPQTREHLDILTLLGVRHGLVALTKVDRVDSESVELARSDVEDSVRGTFLEGTPILPVSSVTAQGFDQFFEALVALLEKVEPKAVDGVFRLPLDRAFSVKGHGTVVSGIPVSGSAHVGDEVVLLPQGQAGRIRGIEVYGRKSDTVMAGQCAALNVRHWEQQTISRGDSLSVPGYFSPSQWHACSLRLLPLEGAGLKNGAKVKFHVGTAEISATVYSMKQDRMESGQQHLVQIKSNVPVVAGPGDHFILRTLSPVQTVGGGMIIEAVPKRLKRNRPHVYEDLAERAGAVQDEGRFVEYCLKTAPSLAAGRDDLAHRAKRPRARVEEILANLVQNKTAIVPAPGLYMHAHTASEAGRRVCELVGAYHRRSPESPGITLEQLRSDSQMDRNVLDGVIGMLKDDARLADRKGRLALPAHQAEFSEEDAKHVEAIEGLFREHPFQPPATDEIAAKTGAPPKRVDQLLKTLIEHERLVRVAEGLFFHREAVDRAREILVEFMRKEGRLESVKFKYLLDTTRKFAIPLLDYFDDVGVTRRVGNTRYLKSTPDRPAKR
jgi:selenocysteine-specific elongation factor